ncbi:MAG: formate dehydrogenase subunit gamma, partial [Alphaproteobacteria bacterium]
MMDQGDLDAILAPYLEERGGLLPALQAVQKAKGHVPREWIGAIAEVFNLSRAEVFGTLSFYHDLHETLQGNRVVRICQAEACQAVGARELASHAKTSLGVEFGETTPDGAVTLEAVYCLGNCACGPSAQIGEKVCGSVTPERFDGLLKQEPVPLQMSAGGEGQKVYVPYETTALAQGSDEVAAAIAREAAARGIDIELVRTGSRGAHWLEPLVEIEVAGKRIAYGPVGGADVAALFDSGFLTGAAHPLQVGNPDELDWFK